MRFFHPLAVGLSLLVVLVAKDARADTIVLKNGRRIAALSVAVEGDKVRYMTSAGELALPKSIVDHIEKGGPAQMPVSLSGAAANLAITPPSVEATGADAAVENGAVHGGVVDRDFLASMASEAQSGAPGANHKAALAYHAVAQFELVRGDMEHALTDERTALTYTPEDPIMLLNVAYLHLRRSENKQALDYLERAQRVAPDNPDVSKLAGWAYYGMNKLKQAVAEWQRSLALRQDPEVQAALDKAFRDNQEEENYRENESSHFTLRYSGEAEPGLAREVLRALETHFAVIESELSYTPPEPIGVILYTQQAFADITSAPGWVGALNDGRIRVPVQGLTQLTPELSRVLKHELTHSFVRQKTRASAPTWIQEGLAQWMEGKRSGANADLLLRVYDAKQAMSLADLQGGWMRLSTEVAAYAYAWSLANMEYIIQVDGMIDVDRILDRMGTGSTAEAAVREVLHSDYEDLMQSTAQYLRKTYGN
jgi:tetratricopeptide (TPR) repeat protein